VIECFFTVRPYWNAELECTSETCHVKARTWLGLWLHRMFRHRRLRDKYEHIGNSRFNGGVRF